MRKILILILLFVFFDVCKAQIFVKSTEQQFIEDIVRKGLFLSKQSFQIYDKESGDIFGLNGKTEFGIQYSIGIKIPKGFLLTDKAVRPWLYDNNFERYKGKYDPIFYQASYSELNGKAVYDTLEYTLAQQEVLIDTTLYRFPSHTFGGEGFILDHTSGEKEGWVVWVTANQEVDLKKTTDLNYTIYKKILTINHKGESFQIDQPYIEQRVVGGIYVVPFYTKIGILEFRLCGVLSSINNKWIIHCPFIDSGHRDESPARLSERKNEKPAELTPIGKTNKEKIKDTKKEKK